MNDIGFFGLVNAPQLHKGAKFVPGGVETASQPQRNETEPFLDDLLRTAMRARSYYYLISVSESRSCYRKRMSPKKTVFSRQEKYLKLGVFGGHAVLYTAGHVFHHCRLLVPILHDH